VTAVLCTIHFKFLIMIIMINSFNTVGLKVKQFDEESINCEVIGEWLKDD